jgi:hypothetical protein
MSQDNLSYLLDFTKEIDIFWGKIMLLMTTHPVSRFMIFARVKRGPGQPRMGPAGAATTRPCVRTMTILHKDEQPLSLKGLMSEHHNCIDCGYNAHPGAPPRELAEFLLQRDGGVPMTYTVDSEVYRVHDAIWKKAGMEPYGGCLCIGCLEKRIGRQLKPKDFPSHAFNNPGIPCTERLSDRRGY